MDNEPSVASGIDAFRDLERYLSGAVGGLTEIERESERRGREWVVAGCWVVVAYRAGMIDESRIAERYRGLGPESNERQRRLWAASEACACGRGGIAAVVRATGIGRSTVVRGIAE
ncbi:MAG: hypothetical protein ACLP01_18730 [Solirubrobacteraceae bacterium]